MVEPKVIMSPFDPLDFCRSELGKPEEETGLIEKKSNLRFLHVHQKCLSVLRPACDGLKTIVHLP